MPSFSQPPIGVNAFKPREIDLAAQRQFEAIAAKIESDTRVLSIPLVNIQRWLNQGHSSESRLRNWSRIIKEAQHSPQCLQRLLNLLRDSSVEASEWKAFSPFAGILSKDELRALSWNSEL